MGLAAEIVIVVFMVLSVLVVAGLFVWAAKKDGEEDRALQKRLGIRRRTRLGR
jgi:flagellar basal body-associated protein FliL